MIQYSTRGYFGLEVLTHVYGSVIPRSIPWALIGTAYGYVLSYTTNFDVHDETFRHPYPVQIFAVVLGFLLVIRSQLAYQRFWEGRTALSQCASKWSDAAIQLITFDEIGKNPWDDEAYVFRMNMIHLMSLLHATLMENLRKDAEHGVDLGISTRDCFVFTQTSCKVPKQDPETQNFGNDEEDNEVQFGTLLRSSSKAVETAKKTGEAVTSNIHELFKKSELQRKTPWRESQLAGPTNRPGSTWTTDSPRYFPEVEGEEELSASELRKILGPFFWWNSVFVGKHKETQNRLTQNRKFFVIGGLSSAEEFALTSKPPNTRVFYVMSWIHRLACRRTAEGGLGVPPPVLSRTYQVLSDGMLGCYQALKVAYTPFPFPWVQLTTFLLICFVGVVPLVIMGFVAETWLRNTLTFVIVLGYSALNEISREIENPFGLDPNNLPLFSYQKDFNICLTTLIRPEVPGSSFPIP
ncbi:hypothetical protein CYMTET_51384 [Cymbomonas tetramitiformis]|uniref:Transmembrane protein n=1 Tax=Cymbomonas tetramitiformis TaxID=36881 RepID=A0AAE0BL63_9CHLO|nr:hypothetical protein CYMTET_51384 [Cymbomonas tetramitiformis]|eukprot:gene1098-1651_t